MISLLLNQIYDTSKRGLGKYVGSIVTTAFGSLGDIVLKIVLTVMSLCIFIMIASSALRMVIYIRYYYLWSLLVLFLCLSVLRLIFSTRIIRCFDMAALS